jgi:hypothetical protein
MTKARGFLFLLTLVLLVVVSGRPASAQTVAPEVSREELLARIHLLEQQMATAQEELVKLKQLVASQTDKSEAERLPSSTTAAQSVKPAADQNVHAPGIDLGDMRLTPYGAINFNGFGNSGGTNNADVPLFATPTGAGNISASARQTKLGLRFQGPTLFDARLSGAVEADFFGGFPNISVGENFGVVRLRLAYGRLDWEKTSLVVGQDWMVFAPVNPVSLASQGIPEMAAAGNPWMRLPQVRIERRWQVGNIELQGQAAVLAPSTADFTSSFLLQPSSGDAARLPFFQSRFAVNQKNWLGLKKPGSVGTSIHYGRARSVGLPNNPETESFGLALDWTFPVAEHFTFAGEAFSGRNLGGFQAGIFQGINTDFASRNGANLTPGGPRAIGTRGGWAQVGFSPPKVSKLTFYGTYGLDDPRNDDLVSLVQHDWRLRNQAYAISFLHRPIAQAAWGIEYRRLETQYLQSGRRVDNHVNLAVSFSF